MDNFLTKMHRFTSKGLYHGVVWITFMMDGLITWMDGWFKKRGTIHSL